MNDVDDRSGLPQWDPVRRQVGAWVARAVWWGLYPLVAALALGAGIHERLDSEAFHNGVTAPGVFSDVAEHSSSSHNGTDHQWSGQLQFRTPTGATYSVTVSQQDTTLHNGGSGTVSYRPADPGDGRWVRGNDDAVELIGVGVAMIVGRAGALGVAARRRRTGKRRFLQRRVLTGA